MYLVLRPNDSNEEDGKGIITIIEATSRITVKSMLFWNHREQPLRFVPFVQIVMHRKYVNGEMMVISTSSVAKD